MNRASYSSAGFEDRGIEAALDAIASVGFRSVELCGRAPHIAVPPTGRAAVEFHRRLTARGLQASTVHGPTERNVLGAPHEAWRTDAVAVLVRYIRFAAAVGAPDIVVHPVPNPALVPNPTQPSSADRIRDAVLRSLQELLPAGEEVGVQILLENLPYRGAYPFVSMHELRPLVEGYPAGQLGLVVDTGHAWVIGNDPVEEIRIAGRRLGGTHLQDVDRDTPEDRHWVPTHGDLDWQAIIGALHEVNYAGAWTFEAHRGRHGETSEAAARQCLRLARRWNSGAAVP